MEYASGLVVATTAYFSLVVVHMVTAGFIPDIERVDTSNAPTNNIKLQCVVPRQESNPLENVQFWLNRTTEEEMNVNELTGSKTVDGTITFDLQQSWEGYYTCSYNDSGTILYSPETGSVTLVFRPSYDSNLDRYHVVSVDNTTAVLECGITLGKLEEFYTVEWFKGDTNVFSLHSRATVLRKYSQDLSLIINMVTQEDSGDYVCYVYVGLEQDLVGSDGSGDITLLVYESPKIDYMSNDLIPFVPGHEKDVIFSCCAVGFPKLAVTWHHNAGRVQDLNMKYNEQTARNSSCKGTIFQLTILNPQLKDSGSVSCNVTISFRDDADNPSGCKDDSALRTLVVLDSNFKFSWMLWASNLVIQIDLFTDEDNVVLSQPLRLKLFFITKDEETATDTTVETYTGVNTFVHLIPELKVPQRLRQFYLKVALVVNNEPGPSTQRSSLIDLDDEMNDDCRNQVLLFVLPLAVGFLGVIATAIFICICYYKHTKLAQQKNENKRIKNESAEMMQKNERITKLESALKSIQGFNLLLNEQNIKEVKRQVDEQYSDVLKKPNYQEDSGDINIEEIRSLCKSREEDIKNELTCLRASNSNAAEPSKDTPL